MGIKSNCLLKWSDYKQANSWWNIGETDACEKKQCYTVNTVVLVCLTAPWCTVKAWFMIIVMSSPQYEPKNLQTVRAEGNNVRHWMKFNEMPRSVAERIDRSSLSRASVGKGSLGRFSVATDISASSAATRHWVNSVSDIYGPDEIEDLLQDLNRLELATFNREDYREFDIDGSQLGGLNTFPVSPVKIPPNQDPPSPTLSVRSWDSHTHYQQFKETIQI